MGSVLSLLVVLAIVAGIGLVIYAAVSSVGKPTSKPWEGYQKPGAEEPAGQEPGAETQPDPAHAEAPREPTDGDTRHDPA